MAEIIAIKKFSSIEEYLNAVPQEKALPGVRTLQEGLKVYAQWNPLQEIEKWGFLAIYIDCV